MSNEELRASKCTKCKRKAVGAVVVPWGSIENLKPICAFHYVEWISDDE